MWCGPSALCLSNCYPKYSWYRGPHAVRGPPVGQPWVRRKYLMFLVCALRRARLCLDANANHTGHSVLILLISSMTSQVTADPITASSTDCISLPILWRSLVHYLTGVRRFCKMRLTDFDTDTFEILKNCPLTLELLQGSKSLRNWQSHSLSIYSPAWFATLRFISSFTRAHHCSLFWSTRIHSKTPISYFTSILILTSNLRLGLTSYIFPSVIWLNISQTLVRATCAAQFRPLHVIAITVVCI